MRIGTLTDQRACDMYSSCGKNVYSVRSKIDRTVQDSILIFVQRQSIDNRSESFNRRLDDCGMST